MDPTPNLSRLQLLPATITQDTEKDGLTHVTNYPFGGALYTGSVNSERNPDGVGILISKNGSHNLSPFKYVGNFRNGKFEGHGKINFLSQNHSVASYQGGFVNGLPEDEGNGTLEFKGKNIIIKQATLSKGKLIKGVLYIRLNENQDQYRGSFALNPQTNQHSVLNKDWKPVNVEGLPLIISNLKGKYYGSINVNWKPTGVGRFVSSEGNYSTEYRGEFNDGLLKIGTIEEINLSTKQVELSYSGPLADLKQHGNGILSLSNNTTLISTLYSGEFCNGEFKYGKVEERNLITKLLVRSFDGTYEKQKFVEGLITYYDSTTGLPYAIRDGKYDEDGTLLSGKETHIFRSENGQILQQNSYRGKFTAGILQEGSHTIIEEVKQRKGIYEGSFVNNKLEGPGNYKISDQSEQLEMEYTGNFTQGSFNGKGIQVLTQAGNKLTLDGIFENNWLISGTKTEEFANNQLPMRIFKGEFNQADPIGQGELFYVDNIILDSATNQKLVIEGKITGIWNENGGVSDAVHMIGEEYCYKGNFNQLLAYQGEAIIIIGNNEYKAQFDNNNLVNNLLEVTSPLGHYKGEGIFDFDCTPYPQFLVTGYGEYYYSNKTIHKGTFQNGLPCGDGTRFLANGSYYTASFKGNELSGIRYYFPNGDYFVESNNNPDLHASHCLAVDVLDNHPLTAFGDLFFANGCSFTGLLKDGQPEGPGEIYFPDGSCFKVEFAQGKLTYVQNAQEYLLCLSQITLIDALALPSSTLITNDTSPDHASNVIVEVNDTAMDENTLLHQLKQTYAQFQSDYAKGMQNYADLNQLKLHQDLTALKELASQLNSCQLRIIEGESKLSEYKNKYAHLQSNVVNLQNKIKVLKPHLKAAITKVNQLITQLIATNKQFNQSSAHQFIIINPHDWAYTANLIIPNQLWEQLPSFIQTTLDWLRGEMKSKIGNPQFKVLNPSTAEIKFHYQFYGDLRILCEFDPELNCYVAKRITDHEKLAKYLTKGKTK